MKILLALLPSLALAAYDVPRGFELAPITRDQIIAYGETGAGSTVASCAAWAGGSTTGS